MTEKQLRNYYGHAKDFDGKCCMYNLGCPCHLFTSSQPIFESEQSGVETLLKPDDKLLQSASAPNLGAADPFGWTFSSSVMGDIAADPFTWSKGFERTRSRGVNRPLLRKPTPGMLLGHKLAPLDKKQSPNIASTRSPRPEPFPATGPLRPSLVAKLVGDNLQKLGVDRPVALVPHDFRKGKKKNKEGPWKCECGNVNEVGSFFCSINSCQKVKPGVTAKAFADAANADPGSVPPGKSESKWNQIRKYFLEHRIPDVIHDAVEALMEELPDDPFEFLTDQIAAHGTGGPKPPRASEAEESTTTSMKTKIKSKRSVKTTFFLTEDIDDLEDQKELSIEPWTPIINDPFPSGIGPFLLMEADDFGNDFKWQSKESPSPDGVRIWCLDSDAAIWSCSKSLQEVSSCIATWPVQGKVCPLQPLITIPQEEVDAMGAPSSAVSFAWSAALPIDFKPDSEKIVAGLGKFEKIATDFGLPLSFLILGGFVFCNEAGDICGVSAICPGAPNVGMEFGAPLNWKPEWTAVLHDRFFPVKRKDLRDQGAFHYCWIRPEERMIDDPEFPLLKYGGFVYLFHEEIAPPDVLYSDVVSVNDRVFPLAKISSGAGKSQLEDYASVVQTPYATLVKAMQGHRDKELIDEMEFTRLMEALTALRENHAADVNTNTHVLSQTRRPLGQTTVGGKSTQSLAPWLMTLGIDETTDKRKTRHTKRASIPAESPDVRKRQKLENEMSAGLTIQAQHADKKLLSEIALDSYSTTPEQINILMLAAFTLWPWELNSKFNLNFAVLMNWLNAIQAQYLKQHYHNWYHAWDVFQFLCVQLTENEDRISTLIVFDPLDVMSLFVATISHDCGHRGLTNQYLVRSEDALAITYNDQSPLENMHAALLFQTLQRGNNAGENKQNFTEPLDQAQYVSFRDKAVHAILSTDMAQHFNVVDNMHVATTTMLNQDCHDIDAKLANAATLKLADVSNCLRTYPTYARAIDLLQLEFYAQGDLERERGFPISPMMDRHKATDTLLDGQQGFISFIVGPLLETTSAILPHICKKLTRQLEKNTMHIQQHRISVAMHRWSHVEDDEDD